MGGQVLVCDLLTNQLSGWCTSSSCAQVINSVCQPQGSLSCAQMITRVECLLCTLGTGKGVFGAIGNLRYMMQARTFQSVGCCTTMLSLFGVDMFPVTSCGLQASIEHHVTNIGQRIEGVFSDQLYGNLIQALDWLLADPSSIV